jgi:hypothetical protein
MIVTIEIKLIIILEMRRDLIMKMETKATGKEKEELASVVSILLVILGTKEKARKLIARI